MAKPPKEKTADDGTSPDDVINPDEELTRPLRRRKPTVAPPPAAASIQPQAPPSAPVKPAKVRPGDSADTADAEPAQGQRKPTLAPPPAAAAMQPQAPPSAPVKPAKARPGNTADAEPTRRQRKPTLAPPPAAAAMQPQAPPSAPGDPLVGLSEPARALLREVAECVPEDSSFDFSQKITDHLVAYWEARRECLLTDDAGELKRDYMGSLRVAKSVIGGTLSGDVENLVEQARSLSDELDATAIGYYARPLPANELRVVQSFHDLAVALMFYKVSFHVEDTADRQVMLVSSMGALGSLRRARDRFAGLPVPAVISKYAGLLDFKIDTEMRKDPR